jgi:hypothetical protein
MRPELPSVRGTLNGTMILRDGPIADLSAKGFQVFASRVKGSLLLDQLCRDKQLFVLLSTVCLLVHWIPISRPMATATEFMGDLKSFDARDSLCGENTPCNEREKCRERS